LGEAKKCFGLNVIDHALLIITKRNPDTPKSAIRGLEDECKELGLKYIYFNTTYDNHRVP